MPRVFHSTPDPAIRRAVRPFEAGGHRLASALVLDEFLLLHGTGWEWGCCETCTTFVFRSPRLTVSSALGTPLEWPEAKKVADQVRNWGIEVSPGAQCASCC